MSEQTNQDGQSESAYGPRYSAAALQASCNVALGAEGSYSTEDIIAAAHDPALPVPDRSYSGEYVIEWLRGEVRAGRADGAIVEQFCIDHTPYDEFYEGVDDR